MVRIIGCWEMWWVMMGDDEWYKKQAKSESGDVWETRSASRFVESVKEGKGGSLLERDKKGLHRGVMMHRLFEVLPEVKREDWEEVARGVLERLRDIFEQEGTFFAEEELSEMWGEVRGVLCDEKLGFLFEEGYAEVPIGGVVVDSEGKSVRVQGRIDRLIVREKEVILVDYKSGRRSGELPEGYRKQMEVYGELVRRIWKGREVRGFVVWTSDVSCDELRDEEMKL